MHGAVASLASRPLVAGFDRAQNRALHAAVFFSLLFHAVLMGVHFRFPEAIKLRTEVAPLEVTLVNASTRERPARPDVLAQANLARGGTTDEPRRARTPLPVTAPRKPGRDLADAERRVRELEAQQKRLLAKAESSRAAVPVDPKPRAAPAEEQTPRSGRDLADLSLAAMRLQAEIDRRIDEYQKRPRKKFLGANAAEYRFAQYEEHWREKVERIGTINYPAEARGKLYGNLRLTVTIRPDGSVDSVELDRSSGLKVLDQAAFKILRMASPFAAFPAQIRKDTDLIVITRTWFFGRGDKIWTE